MKKKIKISKEEGRVVIRKFPLIFIAIFLIVFLFIFSVYAQQFDGGYRTISGSYYGDFGPTYYGEFGSTYYDYQAFRPSYGIYGRYISPSIYWPSFNREDCLERQDFVIQIPPGGCQPAVVRSDLLEEQPVPVFCKVDAIKVNPLVDVSEIESIYFTGKYPKGISGISYYPSRAAIRGTRRSILSSPLLNDVGYVVVVLSRQSVEKEMPDWIEANLTAVIYYDIEGAFGVGKTDFYVPEIPNDEWENVYKDYSFWRGKGYIKADSVEEDRVKISVFRDVYGIESSVELRKGETSHDIYLDGYYCAAGMNIRLDDIIYPVDRIKVQIDDEEAWLVEGERFLDGKCRVRRLEAYDYGGGYATIKCSGVPEFELSLTPGKVKLKVDGVEKEVSIGDVVTTFIEDSKTNNIFVAYIGQIPETVSKENKNFVVLVATESESKFIEKRITDYIASYVKTTRRNKIEDFKKDIESRVKSRLRDKEIEPSVTILSKEREEANFNGKKITFLESYSLTEIEYKETENKKLIEEYYEKATDSYNKVFELYPNEKKIHEGNKEEPFGAKALTRAAELSARIGKIESQVDFLQKVKDNYEGNLAGDAKTKLSKIMNYGTEESKVAFFSDYEYHFIELLDFKKPGKEELSVEFEINNKKEVLLKDEPVYPTDEEGIYIKLIDIREAYTGRRIGSYYREEEDYVEIEYTYKDRERGIQTRTRELKLNEPYTLESGIKIKPIYITAKKLAKITIIPKAYGPRTEADFTFKIGIEKRGIKLSPEKTKEMIENLNKSIEDWEKISDRLKKAVKGWKGACFATSALLMIKNLFEGFSGKSIARQEVMRSKGGWNDKCSELVRDGKYPSIDKCLLDKSSEISKDIETYQELIKEQNEIITKLQEPYTTKSFLGFEAIVDTKEATKAYRGQQFIPFYEQYKDRIIELSKKEKKSLGEIIPQDRIDELSETEMRDIITYMKLKEKAKEVESDVLDNIAVSELGLTLRPINSETVFFKRKAELEQGLEDVWKDTKLPIHSLGERAVMPVVVPVELPEDTGVFSGESISDYKGEKVIFYDFSEASVQSLIDQNTESLEYNQDEMNKRNDELGKLNNQRVMIILEEKGENKAWVEKAFIINPENREVGGEVTTAVNYAFVGSGISEFILASRGLYNNPYKNPEVKFYELSPFKGLPALVPFDVKNGWYVATSPVITGFGKPYEASGRVMNFWVCNVGDNGYEEFQQQGDDICEYINLGTGMPIDVFPGLEAREARELVRKAQTAIYESAEQYGKSKVRIRGQIFDVGVPAEISDGRCQDFMSPQDCHLLFNTCDPVLCPPSRCNLGGHYRVSDVVQTGIIGSIALCLPNAREGILAPICLTGVQAGLDAYVSILKAHRECLQENLETGRTVGICDEIKSIYLCEFFWRQFAPMMEVFIPKLVESAYGQGTRGGGEYLTITHAWQNMDKSVDYFKNQYAINAMKAFNLRATDEAGTEICKAFISARYPASKDYFDALLEPESPPQFHAWFEEIPFTEATVPATSQYKVYYHIWAGKDFGASYFVYLRSPLETGYYQIPWTVYVDSGYIRRGGYVDETRDFIADSGYRELCVSVNGQEECGFGRVSTSFALDYIKDKYVEEQATQQITTEQECIAGKPSLLPLAQPNIQAGVEQAAIPAVYKSGVIRVCASENPGAQIDPTTNILDKKKSRTDRWKEVGYCGDKTVRCWVDTENLKRVINENKLILNNTLEEIDKMHLRDFEEQLEKPGVMTEDETAAVFDEIEKEKKLEREEINEKLDSILNYVKAEESLLRKKSLINSEFKNIIKELTDLEKRGTLNADRAEALFKKGEFYAYVTIYLYEKFVEEKEEPATVTTTTQQKQEKTIEEKATEDPQGFIYRVYSKEVRRYIFYRFSNNKWEFAISTKKDQNLDRLNWRLNSALFYDTESKEWRNPSEGLEIIREANEEVYYIKK